MAPVHKLVLFSLALIVLQACSQKHYSRSTEHDDLYFNGSDSKKWQVAKNPSYDANYKAPTPTPPVVDPNVYQFSSGQSTNTNNKVVADKSSATVTKRNGNRSRIQTNFMVGSMFGPGYGYNNYNNFSFNIAWFYSNYYGYNSYWSPYTYTPYYCNTYINPYAGYWYGPYSMPMYPSYGYGNSGYYGNNYGYYNNNYGYYNGYAPMYYQPSYMSYPSYYTPQSGYNTVSTPKPTPAPKPMTGSTTGNTNYPANRTTTTSPYQNKSSYTPTNTSRPSTTTTYPRGTQNTSTPQQRTTPAPQQRQSYTPQNSYQPPQQSYSPPQQHNYNPPQQNYNPAPRGGGGGGSTGTPNPRMR
ncbi:MAG: hypothetical protein U0U66_14285 [Cytophagaceae bacterium]